MVHKHQRMLTIMHCLALLSVPAHPIATHLGRHGSARAASETLRAAIGGHSAPPATGSHPARRRDRPTRCTHSHGTGDDRRRR